jgi:hypothetical protein
LFFLAEAVAAGFDGPEWAAARNAISGTQALSTAGHRIAKRERQDDNGLLEDRRTQLE